MTDWIKKLFCRRHGEERERIPMQPVVMVDGVARFKENRIVSRLLEHSRSDLWTSMDVYRRR